MPMNFPYLKAARVKLQERKNSCIRANYASSEKIVAQLFDFIRTNTILQSVVAEIERLADAKYPDANACIDSEQQSLNLPATVVESAALYFRLLSTLADPNPTNQIPEYHWVFGSGSTRFQDMYDDFVQQVLLPFCNYLDERIDDGDLLLYMLSRYQRECGWFEDEKLRLLLKETQSRQVEAVLDRHLREWLFREGIDYPFSTPRSPSGRADIVVWHGEEPLPIEVKVFDGEGRDTAHVSQGLWQASRYAGDYGKPFGYLVVFNIADKILTFDGAVPGDGPPCVTVGDRPVFAVVVNLHATEATASKERPLPTVSVPLPG